MDETTDTTKFSPEEQAAFSQRADLVCDRCHGTGAVMHGRLEVKCPWCDGNGTKPLRIATASGVIREITR